MFNRGVDSPPRRGGDADRSGYLKSRPVPVRSPIRIGNGSDPSVPMSGGPTRTSDDEGKSIPPIVRPGNVTQHVGVLVCRDPTEVEGVDVLGESVHDRLDFGLKGAE